jgi:hypothetical protein
MDVVALWALKGVDMEAPTAGSDPRQHRCCFADWTHRSDMEGHDARLVSGGSATLSVTGWMPLQGR